MEKLLLHDDHVGLGARMAPFAGWEMPVQYSGILEEHRAVREAVGVFDISHMGQIFVRGGAGLEWLNGLLTNDASTLDISEGQYSLMLNEKGGVIDDLILYRVAEDEVLLVVNASMLSEDFQWMREKAPEGVELTDESGQLGGLAIQGPRTKEVFDRLLGHLVSLPARNHVARFATREGEIGYLCRTGYTGEDGFEVFAPNESLGRLFRECVGECAVRPCGLGARDTLRLEMGYPLNGSDLTPDRSPLEAGLGFFVKLDKGDFVGSEALKAQKAHGLARKLAGFKMTAKGPPPRVHYGIYDGDDQVGEASSAALSPTLGIGIGMAYLPVNLAAVGTELTIDVRGRRYPIVVVKKPFFRKSAS